MAKERADIKDWGLASVDEVAMDRPMATESLVRRCPVMKNPVV
tara:strand:- start:669 stop:797 length:129 start_codon:yes stop_codon:yes gene_type:complete